MSANLENSTVATGLEKVSFHFNLKEGQCLRMFKLCQQIWKTQQWPRTGKGQFSFQSQRKTMLKNVQTTTQLHSFHTLAK